MDLGIKLILRALCLYVMQFNFESIHRLHTPIGLENIVDTMLNCKSIKVFRQKYTAWFGQYDLNVLFCQAAVNWRDSVVESVLSMLS